MSGVGPTTRRQVELILKVLEGFPEGLPVGSIADELKRRHGVRLGTSAIAYRLRLVTPLRVTPSGDGKGRRYRLAGSVAPAVELIVPTGAPTWLTPEGAAIRAAADRPRGERRYVTYHRAWLEAYAPGFNWYLSEGTRAHLHQIGTPGEANRPAGTFARDILSRLLIDLSWASSRLEGNTYSRLDTQNLIEFGQRAAGKDALETQMILNHKGAIEFLAREPEALRLDELTVRSLHALLSEALLPNAADEGRLRATEVRIGASTYIPTADPNIIRECFALIISKANAITDPFEQSLFLLVHLPYLQPFVDVNKRTSRLAANIPLIQANLCPLTFLDVPEQEYLQGTLAIYETQQVELLRDVFVHAYERSCEQYLAIRQAAPAPSPLRIRHREALTHIVGEVVRAGTAPTRDDLRSRAVSVGITTGEMEEFIDIALSILLNLNEASAARHGLRPSEFHEWRDRFRT
jgi:hypothetical protein